MPPPPPFSSNRFSDGENKHGMFYGFYPSLPLMSLRPLWQIKQILSSPSHKHSWNYKSTSNNFRYCAKEERLCLYLFEKQKPKALFSVLSWYCCLHMSNIWGLFRSTDPINRFVYSVFFSKWHTSVLANFSQFNKSLRFVLLLLFYNFFQAVFWSLVYIFQLGLIDFIFNLSHPFYDIIPNVH